MLERSTFHEFVIPDGPPEGEFSIAAFVLLPAASVGQPDAPPSDAGDTTEPSTGGMPLQPVGMPVVIYAGACSSLPDNPVAQLDDAFRATGESVGFSGAAPVATSYTELDIPFDTLADGSHLIAIFSDANPDLPVACGGIGGQLADNGALAVGLLPEGGNGYPAVAYITPLDGGARSSITVFVILPAEAGS
jgi:hypothetical protein